MLFEIRTLTQTLTQALTLTLTVTLTLMLVGEQSSSCSWLGGGGVVRGTTIAQRK